jgi:monovalent cation/hydrogen antiporter
MPPASPLIRLGIAVVAVPESGCPLRYNARMHLFEWLLVLLVAAVALTAVARRLKLPYPSLIALGGVALAFVPHTPDFRLDPELTLALFVAPVLLDAAFDTSLRDLKRYWIPVIGLVVVAVGITTFAVAWLVHTLVPAMPWAAAIALGAIVAPPDAAAASAILRHLHLPHRMVVVLEGESLLNDATALLIYRLAVSAAMGTTFTTATAGIETLAMLGSVVVGFLLAHLFVRMLERVSDIPSAIVLQFAGAFGIWILAEKLGLSAIVTVVTFAVTTARLAPARTPARVRIPTYAVWETVVFVLNVLAFVLIGLQLRPILLSLEPAQRVDYLQTAAAVLAMVIAVRVAWVFTYNRAAYLKQRWLGAGRWPGPYIPTLAGSAIVSWCGMRGIVTLAAAYALPEQFPYRDLTLLCAFCVVVGTLIVQGLTLRPLILALGVEPDDTVQREVRRAQDVLALTALDILEAEDSDSARALRDEFVTTEVLGDDSPFTTTREARNHLRVRIIEAQRRELSHLRETGVIGDDAFHSVEEWLDRNEMVVR